MGTMRIPYDIPSPQWLVIGLYKPPNQNKTEFINFMNSALNEITPKYENIMLLGDFNMTPKDTSIQNICNTYSFKNLVNEPTCFKGVIPTCIDLVLTNQNQLLMKTTTHTTGISDVHKLVTTIFKSTYVKGNPITKYYRDYKNFDRKNFEIDLRHQLHSNEEVLTEYSIFQQIFIELLDKHAPIKKKILRANNSTFMTKALRKAIMQRSRLKNIYYKTRNAENWNSYKKQRNFCTNLLRDVKKEYYGNLNIKELNDNKKFWKMIKPYFSDKGLNCNKMILREEDDLITNESQIAGIMNHYFLNVTKDLKLKPSDELENLINIEDILSYFKDHDSIKLISSHMESSGNDDDFMFKTVTEAEVKTIILNLNEKKSAVIGSIPCNILKETCDIHMPFLTKLINEAIRVGRFPDELKIAEVTPVFKKSDQLKKENYRPISILSHISKIYERIIHNQISEYMENKFSVYLTGFRKNHGTQHALLKMIEKWKETLDVGMNIGAIFMDLSKAFDTLNSKLLIAKMNAYGFNKKSLLLILSYFQNRLQRTNINNNFSPWEELNIGVPQGSILGPLFFNIFLNDIFLCVDKCCLCNYADDNTLFSHGNNITTIKNDLEQDFSKLDKWFNENYMVLNPEKCHFMCLGPNISTNENFTYKQFKLENSSEEKLLGVKIDKNLNFDSHIKDICKAAGRKLNALLRLCNTLSLSQQGLIINSFIKGQFNYCPLVWMFTSRKSNNLINRIHERTLRLLNCCQPEATEYKELLSISNEFTIHDQNIQKLMIEVYKYINDLSPPIMNEIFQQRESIYNLRNSRVFQPTRKYTLRYGTETIQYKASQLWELVPNDIKHCQSLSEFKQKIKQWRPIGCPCRLCMVFVPNLGYL